MALIRQPRLWTRILGLLVLLVALWILLIPITAVYVTTDVSSIDNLGPHDVSVLYSWWTSDESLAYSDGGPDKTHVVRGVRLNCGNTILSGANEKQEKPDGPIVCSKIERPRHITGWSLLGFSIMILFAATKIPARTSQHHDHYRMGFRQRRLLTRGR